MLSNKAFIEKSIELVRDYANDHLDKSDGKTITNDDVYVVWDCFILGHQKALLSTTLYDGMYYEVTYNNDKNEIYFDAYKKFENKCIKMD